MQLAFGSGSLFVTPISDAFGAAIATPTPFLLGVLQDCSVDSSFDTKELYGQGQFPVDIGRGKGKIAVKAKAANISMKTWNAIMYGQGVGSGSMSIYNDVIGTAVPPASPYQITPNAPNSGTYAGDLGVRYKLTGQPLQRVASGTTPTVGQYSISGGVYTFAAADAGLTMLISYRYSLTTGSSIAVGNLPMGEIPTFQAELYLQKGGKPTYVCLYLCVASKLGLSTKQDDYMIPDFDMMAFANSAGQVELISATE